MGDAYWLEYKRTGNDPNASLLDEFARVAVEAKPAAVLMENVWSLAYRNHNTVPFGPTGRSPGERRLPGSLGGPQRGRLRRPQLRKRLILYAMLGDEPPGLPRPTHSGWTETKRRIRPHARRPT